MFRVLLFPDLGSLDSGLDAHFKNYQRKNANGVGVVLLTCH